MNDPTETVHMPFKGPINDLRRIIERFNKSYTQKNAQNVNDIFTAVMNWPEKMDGQVFPIGTLHTRLDTEQKYTQEYTKEGWLEVVRQTDQQTELIGRFKTVEAEKFVKALMRKIESDGLRVGMPAQPAAANGAESEQPAPLTKDEIARLIAATLIREEIAFDRQETGGTIEFTAYQGDEVAGQFYAIDGDRFGVRQTNDTHADWMTQIKSLIERQMLSRYSNGRDAATKRLVEAEEAYAKTDDEIRQTIDIVRAAGSQLNQTHRSLIGERV